MTSWLSEKVRRLRSWLLVRLGLWRGSWRRGRVTVERGSVYFNPLAPRTWRYGLYCPPGLSDDQGAPLIIVLHGCKQRALSFAQAGGWIRLADRAGVRLLCPDQRRLANLWRCWNWFHPLAQRGHGELLAVLRMVDDVATRVQIREEAIAAVGISAGGAMAALLAFHHPGRVRAAVAVAAPPLLGEFGAVNARDVLRRGLQGQPTQRARFAAPRVRAAGSDAWGGRRDRSSALRRAAGSAGTRLVPPRSPAAGRRCCAGERRHDDGRLSHR